MRRFVSFTLLAPLFLAVNARAVDSFNFDGFKYSGTILGLRDGLLWVNLTGNTEKLYDLSKVQNIQLAATQSFSDAEEARADDPKKSAALYKEAIKAINSVPLKQLAEFRAIEPADADGHWTEAIVYFLDVYEAAPTDAVWKNRPKRLPSPPSTMLRESADKIGTAIRTAKTDEVRKNLRALQLEIYNKAGDTENAQRLAREISTGVVEDPLARPRENTPAAQSAASVAEIEAALRAKNFDAVIRQSDALAESLPPGNPDAANIAVQAFLLKARAYEEQNNLDLATATLLRIPAHYPGNDKAAATALFMAADLQKRNNHPAEAAQLYQEILTKYPDSKEAPLAKQAGAK